MPPAHRHLLRAKKKTERKVPRLLAKIIIIILVIIGIWSFIKLSTDLWNGYDKFSFVYRLESGDVGVTVLDPKLTDMTTLIIPGDTEVNVAKGYGTLRIKNVWQLGVNERLNGSLLAGTVTQNFLFPTVLWSDSIGDNIEKADISGLFNFIFFPGKTNIPFGDRLNASLFALKVQDLNKSVIDLGKSQFLHKETLSDGEPGYILTGPVSQRLSVYFSDNDMSTQDIRVNIVDSTGVFGVAQKVGEIVEVLGGKIVSLDKKDINPSLDCQVLGNNPRITKKIAVLFSCKTSTVKTSFDLEVRLGQLFAKRF